MRLVEVTWIGHRLAQFVRVVDGNGLSRTGQSAESIGQYVLEDVFRCRRSHLVAEHAEHLRDYQSALSSDLVRDQHRGLVGLPLLAEQAPETVLPAGPPAVGAADLATDLVRFAQYLVLGIRGDGDLIVLALRGTGVLEANVGEELDDRP